MSLLVRNLQSFYGEGFSNLSSPYSEKYLLTIINKLAGKLKTSLKRTRLRMEVKRDSLSKEQTNIDTRDFDFDTKYSLIGLAY